MCVLGGAHIKYIKLSFLFLIFLSNQTLANNGDFIVPDHPWFERAKAVVPIYQGVQYFDYDKSKLALGEEPQASCTGTLINEGKHILSASHCFREICEARRQKGKYHEKSDFFILVEGEKMFFEDIHLHPLYCKLAYELPYKEKVAPNPMFPEVAYDIAIAKIRSEHIESIQSKISFFPEVRLEEAGTEASEEFTKIGFGVSSRFALQQTLWVDKDKDNVHDYWDLCPNTQVALVPEEKRVSMSFMLEASGCSKDQMPESPALVLDYYTSNKISHKRGYSFSHFSENSFIFSGLNLDANLFLVNHGFYGSLKPYKNYSSMSFGGDSGGPNFNKELSEVVAITILLNNSQDFVMEHIRAQKLKSEERRDLLHGGFNSLLKTSWHKDFIQETLKK